MVPSMASEDDIFFERYGEVFFDVHVPQFSHDDLGKIFPPDTMLKVGNWINAGYVKPDFWKDPRGGKDRRRYSIIEITRIAIIDSLVNGIGLKPSHAAQIADVGITFLNDSFDRHPDNVLKSTAHMFVASWLGREDGKVKSDIYYRKVEDADDPYFYLHDPHLNPDAKRFGPLKGTAVHLPLTGIFQKIYLECAKFLASRGRGMLDKYRRPID